MLRHTVGTKVDLVYLAMNYRQVAMANIAATSDASRRVPGLSRDRSLGRGHGPSSQITSCGRDHGSQGNSARAQREQAGVNMFAQSRG